MDTENSKYTPTDYGRDDKALAIKDIVTDKRVDRSLIDGHNPALSEALAISMNGFNVRWPRLYVDIFVDVGLYTPVLLASAQAEVRISPLIMLTFL